MTLSLPIPGKKKKFSFFFVPYEINEGYVNYSGEIFLRDTETIADFRQEFEKKYQKDAGSFIITKVNDNMFKRMLD